MDYEKIAAAALQAMAAADLHRFLVVCALVSDLYCLSCANGLPVGYRCAFSPETLRGSGNASLLILPTLKVARLHLFGNGWPGITAAFVFLLMLGSGTHRQSRLLLVLFAVSLITALSGCRSSTSSLEAQQTVVLTVQASAASGSQAIIHSAQIPLRLPAAN